MFKSTTFSYRTSTTKFIAICNRTGASTPKSSARPNSIASSSVIPGQLEKQSSMLRRASSTPRSQKVRLKISSSGARILNSSSWATCGSMCLRFRATFNPHRRRSKPAPGLDVESRSAGRCESRRVPFPRKFPSPGAKRVWCDVSPPAPPFTRTFLHSTSFPPLKRTRRSFTII